MSRLAIAPSDPTSPEARALIAELDHYLGGLYAPQDNHLLDPARLKAPDIRFLLASLDGQVVGCGALRLDAGYAEVKRMWVDPTRRGQGIAGAIVAALEDAARAEGINVLKLETGDLQREAVGLYAKLGFTRCAAFGDYPAGSEASIFMEKRLF